MNALPRSLINYLLIGLISLTFLSACERNSDPAANEKPTAESTDNIVVEPSNADLSDADLDQLAQSYVQLVLALGNHDKSYVDAYYGPAEWRQLAKADTASPAELAQRAETLAAQLPAEIDSSGGLESLRQHYLKTQLRAVAAHAHNLAGSDERSFEREAQLLYDTQPPQRDFAEFEPILAKLESELPGSEPLHLRVQKFQQRFEIPKQKMEAVFNAAIDACRSRTKQHIELPEGEHFVLEYVQDKPWSGYNWYQGDANSLIQINTELPIYIDRAIDLGCHEGYPGHHTYNALLEEKLVKQRGWVEFSVYPLFSPQSLIAEGSANYGIDLAFPGAEKTAFERDVLYPLARLNPDDAEKYDRVLALISQLNFAGNEIARQYIDGKIDGEKVVELFQKYTVMSPEKARQRLRFVDSYGAYVINYNWGKQLVKEYVEQGADTPQARWDKFSKLLSSPRLPSSLNW